MRTVPNPYSSSFYNTPMNHHLIINLHRLGTIVLFACLLVSFGVIDVHAQETTASLNTNTQGLSGIDAWRQAEKALQKGDYKTADYYADLALADDNSAQLGAEIKAQCMRAQMVTPQDSAQYLAVVSKLYETDPNNEKYFAWMMQFYDRPQQRHKLEYFVDKELENNPNSIVPWILKGEIAMKAGRWQEAVDAYKHADEISPSNTPVAYNIGICLNHLVLDKQEKVKKAGKRMTEHDTYQMKQTLAEARNYLERVRTRDPRRNRLDWVTPLYMIYSVLGDKIKADELKPLVTGFRNEI